MSSWTEVEAIGQIAGTVVVAVSLFYLAIQVRQSALAIKAESARAAVAAVRDFNESMINDPRVARIFRLGAEGLDRLTEDERAQFAHVALNFFKTAEDLHYQYLRGTLDPEVWESWRTLVSLYGTSPGFREYWIKRSAFFTRSFRTEYESWEAPPIVRVDQFAKDATPRTTDDAAKEPTPVTK